MKSSQLISIFLRSLLIQASLNFWRMQNLGFVYALIPLVKSLGDDKGRKQRMLSRHMQFFNSHPYMTSPILGSVVQIEEVNLTDTGTGNSDEALTLKNTLSGPYAAIGDSFFWGAYRPFSALVGVFFAIEECFAAPLLTFVMYNTVHLWIRWKGFFEGYRLGRQGIDFVRYLDLPEKSGKIRWASLSFLALLAVLLSSKGTVPFLFWGGQVIMKIGGLLCILLCFWGIKKGVSPVHILYGMVIIIFLLSY
jgi:mannose PTS system EIID component